MKPELQPFPPTVMSAKPRVIVCERRAIWATSLRGRLLREIVVRQIRLLDDCFGELELAPASLLIVEVTPTNLPQVLALGSDLAKRFPQARWLAVAERGFAELGEWTREAGAVHFTTSPRESGNLASIARRHIAQVPQSRVSLAKQLWESLPWQETPTI